MTKNLALELAPIRVNLIAAGFVDTPLSASLLGDQLDARREQLRTTLPIRRVVGPADIAALAVHLMTNTAVTGATFDIDGGQQLVEDWRPARLRMVPRTRRGSPAARTCVAPDGPSPGATSGTPPAGVWPG